MNLQVLHRRYGKKEAAIMSGVALLLMLIHHFFGFRSFLRPDVNWLSVFSVGGIEIERIIGAFGKICVSIFAFNSGYVLFTRQREYKSFSQRFHRIIKFLSCYWIICVFFWAYALLVGDNIPTGSDMVYNLLGLRTGPEFAYVNVTFAWYVAFYIFFILVSPLVLKVFSHTSSTLNCGFLILSFILIHYISKYFDPLNFIWPLYISLSGFIVAKYRVFDRLWSRFGDLPVFVSITVLLVLIISRQSILLIDSQIAEWGGVIEPLFVIVLVYSMLSLLNKIGCVRLGLAFSFIGAYSMNLWFLHGIFFSGLRIMQPVLYFPQYSILVFLWGLLLLVPVSWIVSRIQLLLMQKCGLDRFIAKTHVIEKIK